MSKNNLALGKKNFILIAISMVLIIIGFILMGGDSSTNEVYNPEIFNATRIKVAPVTSFIGFIIMIVALTYKPNTENK